MKLEDLEFDKLAFRRDGLCASVDPEIFFPKQAHAAREPKSICVRCPVREECLMYAIHNNCVGIWGGTSDRERMKLRSMGV